MKPKPSNISLMYPFFISPNLSNYNHFPVNSAAIFPSYNHHHTSYLYPSIPTYNNDELTYNIQRFQVDRYEELIINQLHLCLQNKNFAEVYKLIEYNTFSQKNHAQLQELWYTAHYEEAKFTKKIELTPVSKYRIRKKYPLPMTIWDGEETSYCFKETSRELLKKAFQKSQFPSAAEKKLLAEQTGLNKDQICNWFKNRRQRFRNNGMKNSENVPKNDKNILKPEETRNSFLGDLKKMDPLGIDNFQNHFNKAFELNAYQNRYQNHNNLQTWYQFPEFYNMQGINGSVSNREVLMNTNNFPANNNQTHNIRYH